MGWRFRRSWRVVPGVRFNFGLKSASVSFGPRGLHYTVGTRGSRVTAGIPGTGLFWTQNLSGATRPQRGTQNRPSTGATAQPQAQQPRVVAPSPPVGAQIPVPQPPTFAPFAGAQPSRFIQHFSLPLRRSAQNTQQAMQLGVATRTHLTIPTWLLWAALAVMVIAGLCLVSAMLGNLVR
jgi:Protein of unknown function (DUF4236)